MIDNDRRITIPDPYDDEYKEAAADFRRLPREERIKILQEIGILGPDGQLAPAYADDEVEPGDSAVQAAST